MPPVEIVVEIETDIDRALARWLSLESRGRASAFQTHAYLSSWYETVAPARASSPLFVFVRLDGRDRVALPLVVERSAWTTCITIADAELTDYALALIDGDRGSLPDADVIWSRIVEALPPSDYVDIPRIPALPWRSGPDVTRLPMLERMRHSAYPLPLVGVDPRQNLMNARARANLARCRRRLNELGELEFRASTDSGQSTVLYDRMMDFRFARFGKIGRSDALRDHKLREFYRNLCGRHPNFAVVTGLFLDGEPIALQYGLTHLGRYYQIISSFAEGIWTAHSPGRLLMFDTMHWCARTDIGIYDFTYGNDEYKQRFGAEELPLLRLVQPRTLKGWVYLFGERTRRRFLDAWNAAESRLLRRR